jgi:hypothetical protein
MFPVSPLDLGMKREGREENLTADERRFARIRRVEANGEPGRD